MRYAPGTRYSDSETYDEATDEFVHGWQVFVQKRADGEPTGRRSFVNNAGVLCDLAMAEVERKYAVSAAAPDMVCALEEAAKVINGLWTGDLPACYKPSLELVNAINVVLERATGSAA